MTTLNLSTPVINPRRGPARVGGADIIWTHLVNSPSTGGPTLRGRLQHHDRSRYVPHQGAQECMRRRG